MRRHVLWAAFWYVVAIALTMKSIGYVLDVGVVIVVMAAWLSAVTHSVKALQIYVDA
jgi:hypothetical protein